ncbi:GNAT family N-acetyltransferase [Mesorhizobium ciceri]|uniref:hypothetical protein n=1 Tax=Mesorhizobium TaxID=68287 RepID=UPI0007A93F87|nr:hypothetical protein [Mesorhizobium ciceri]AMX98799.1 hypothetical protein A4R29_04185 [Mesorhizobium ciceri biovar biserrulae]
MTGASPVFLRDVASGGVVAAELVCGIDVPHLLDWHNAWQPELGAIKATLYKQGVPKSEWPQSGHWRWPDKVEEGGLLGFETFCVTAAGMTQAMMRVNVATKESRLEDSAGKPIAYVDYLEVAPWNQPIVGMQRRFKGAGTILMVAAAALSVDQEFKGRVGLHALPQSEVFYRDIGMIDLGPDAEVPGKLHYFEMTAEVAQALIAQE